MQATATQRAPVSPLRIAVLLGTPFLIALAAAVYLAVMIDDMAAMPAMSSMQGTGGSMAGTGAAKLWGLFAMWTVMMAAMMLPTAAPMIAAYARMRGREADRFGAWRGVISFAAGYLIAWAAYSAVATGVQALLTEQGALAPMAMEIVFAPLAAAVLIAAGAYQFLPFKRACLNHCRTPIGFLMTAWRDGAGGALAMGIRHGAFCVGCCAALMALLFVAGVMNPLWIIGLTAYALIEKVAPHGVAIAQVSGAGLILAGLAVLVF